MTKLELRLDADLDGIERRALAKGIRDLLRERGLVNFTITDGTFTVGVSKSVSFKE